MLVIQLKILWNILKTHNHIFELSIKWIVYKFKSWTVNVNISILKTIYTRKIANVICYKAFVFFLANTKLNIIKLTFKHSTPNWYKDIIIQHFKTAISPPFSITFLISLNKQRNWFCHQTEGIVKFSNQSRVFKASQNNCSYCIKFKATTIHKIFGTNSSFHVKHCTMEKV